jgi:ABC-2 type transport system ATP-binding protein
MTSTNAHENAVLEIRGLSKHFRLGFFRKSVHAVRDVSFDVKHGEIFGLLGPNGAGKTTTLKVAMGLVRATSGDVSLLGRSIGDPAAKSLVGYLPESPYFYDYLSGRELLILVGRLCGLTKKEAAKRADQLLERVGLGHAAKRSLRRYSKGMLQRVGLAQALINDPKFVVLDEPLTGLDPIGRKQLRELIAQLRQEGKTVMLSSHILSDVEQLADRAVIIVRGRSVASGPLDTLVDARVLENEVLIDKVADELLSALKQAKLHAEHVGDLYRLVIDHERIDELVDLVRKHDATIVSLLPIKESLEDVVVRMAQQSDSDGAGASSKTASPESSTASGAQR